MHLRTYYPTVVLSDIHLGTSRSKTIEVSNFLKSVNCDRLILNGDIIDGWHLRKAGTKKWQARHTDFFKVIMKMMENFGTEVIYVDGNWNIIEYRHVPVGESEDEQNISIINSAS